ncbi:hypothetical protein V8C37DRAFT_31127 [Trichoderma ceciliae]
MHPVLAVLCCWCWYLLYLGTKLLSVPVIRRHGVRALLVQHCLWYLLRTPKQAARCALPCTPYLACLPACLPAWYDHRLHTSLASLSVLLSRAHPISPSYSSHSSVHPIRPIHSIHPSILPRPSPRTCHAVNGVSPTTCSALSHPLHS